MTNFLSRQFLVFTSLACAIWLSGCSTSGLNSYKKSETIAANSGFQKQYISAGKFELLTYSRITSPGSTVTIYIEGDGAAWISKNRLSPDPTPRNPLALKLAVLDQGKNVVYLARPCQYVLKERKEQDCSSFYWSTGRFSEEVVVAMNEACTAIMASIGATELHLVGYSGGGAVAVLLAITREDVSSIRTIAGNLDHAEVNRLHRVSSLSGSLNPIDVAQMISQVPQIHFVGDKDTVVPPSIAHRFVAKQNVPTCGKVAHVHKATHANGWESAWPSLLHTPFPACQGQ